MPLLATRRTRPTTCSDAASEEAFCSNIKVANCKRQLDNIEGVAYDCGTSSALAIDVLQSYNKPSINHLIMRELNLQFTVPAFNVSDSISAVISSMPW